MEIVRVCPSCKEPNTLELDEKYREAFSLWRRGLLIQQTDLIELPPEKREFLISGMCMKCQREFYGHGEED